MTTSNLQILFLGDREYANSLRPLCDSQGWNLYAPTEMMEALAMTVFYLPNLVLVRDGDRQTFLRETMAHLLEVQVPGSAIVLLTEEGDWIEGATLLPADLSPAALVEALQDTTTTHPA
jgi:hypothetical protein